MFFINHWVLSPLQLPAFRDSFSDFLRALAFCDALFLSVAAAALGLPTLAGPGSAYRETVFPPVAAVAFGLLHTFRVGSVYVTVAGRSGGGWGEGGR